METDNKQSSASDAADATAMPWFDDLKKLLEKFQLPGIDLDAVLDWQRKDMDALFEANRQALEGIKALVERRNDILQETLAQWQAGLKDAAGPDLLVKQSEAARQSVEQVMANFRELAELETRSRSNVWKVMQDRLQENMTSLQKILQPK